MSIAFEKYSHPLDIQYLENIKKLPMLDKALKKYLEKFDEVSYRTLYLGSSVKVSERQFPKIHERLSKSCNILGIDEPELFISGSAEANAFTFGDTSPLIVISAGLLYRVTEDELNAIIAHECGHIAGRHLLYHSLGNAILYGSSRFLGSFVAGGLLMKFFQWMRASEYSCDRAASLAMGSSQPVQSGLLKLATGNAGLLEKIDLEECFKQADTLDKYTEDTWKKFISFMSVTSKMTHPFLIHRVRELTRWTATEDYKNLLCDDDGNKLDLENPSSPIQFM
ncbi:MAG: M48 family metallopeptidase [Synergistaceae bacterium]|nr:M48 family metallopeptidase [Synergistaceae bacterium]